MPGSHTAALPGVQGLQPSPAPAWAAAVLRLQNALADIGGSAVLRAGALALPVAAAASGGATVDEFGGLVQVQAALQELGAHAQVTVRGRTLHLGGSMDAGATSGAALPAPYATL